MSACLWVWQNLNDQLQVWLEVEIHRLVQFGHYGNHLSGSRRLSQPKTSWEVSCIQDRRPAPHSEEQNHFQCSSSQRAFHWEQSAVTQFPAGRQARQRRPKGWRHPPAHPESPGARMTIFGHTGHTRPWLVESNHTSWRTGPSTPRESGLL